MEMYIGDDDLRQQIERMDKLSEIKWKLRAYQYLENLRNEVLADNLYRTEKKTERQQKENLRNESLADSLCRTEEKVERQQEQSMADESRRIIIIAKIEAELLKRILPSNRNSVMAVKWRKIIKEHHQKMANVHKELSRKLQQHEGDPFEEFSRDLEKKLKEIEDYSIADSFRKLENVNQTKWNATLDAWKEEKRNQILFSILVDQMRKIRTRRCQQMAGKMMRKLQDRHLVLKNLQGELMEKTKERENMRQTKKAIEEELLTEIKRKEEMKKRQKMLQMKLMKFHLERAVEEDTHFIPRKLFLSSVEPFKTVPKLENAPSKVVKDGPSVSTSLTYEDQPQPKPKRGTKPTLKSRIKKIFGFH